MVSRLGRHTYSVEIGRKRLIPCASVSCRKDLVVARKKASDGYRYYSASARSYLVFIPVKLFPGFRDASTHLSGGEHALALNGVVGIVDRHEQVRVLAYMRSVTSPL